MNSRRLLVVPLGGGVGLTSICLGLVRALDQLGVRYAFCRPISVGDGPDTSSALMSRVAHLDPPDPVTLDDAEAMLGSGEEDVLLELVVERVERAGADADVVVVEGVVPLPGVPFSARINAAMAEALDADVVWVGRPSSDDPARVANQIDIASRAYGRGGQRCCVLNRVPVAADHVRPALGGALGADADPEGLAPWADALRAEGIHPLGVLPELGALAYPRVSEVAAHLGAEVLNAGDMAERYVRGVAVCAASARFALSVYRPGMLVIVPSDRDDVLLGVALASLGGLEFAGVLLSTPLRPDPGVLALCQPAFDAGLPLLGVPLNSYETATAVHDFTPELGPEDAARAELAMNLVAAHLDQDWLESLVESERERRMSTPAFRHKLIQLARKANARIVMPEGDEPRTLAAAEICARRGIARPVLLGDPATIRAAALRQGLSLPDEVEIIEPTTVLESYVEGMVARRAHKGLTVVQARDRLHDRVMLGTMMLAEGHVDGLVSGAVHSTADTIRPALQLIRTAPDAKLVSSVFFMCLPSQVLVYGDCAVNPNPSAEELAEIALQSAASAEAFGIPPRVAMISYSTGASGSGEDVEKVVEATALARQRRPDLLIDGPLQYDAAAIESVAQTKAPDSPVAGRATVFVFPDLNTGNTVYKAVQRSAGVVSMGPMLQGLAKPVNDLSRGALVDDIVFTIALTAVQASS